MSCAAGSCGVSKVRSRATSLPTGGCSESTRNAAAGCNGIFRLTRCRPRCWWRWSIGPKGLTVLLTQRASQLAKHAAQISFPGGRLEDTDADVAGAALREAQEEIGLDPARVRVFGYLPDHLVFSGFRVTPVLSLVTPPFALAPNPAEVAEVFEVPVSHVFDAGNHKARLRRVGDEDMLLYDIPWQGQNIWGATAGMLLTLVRMVQEEPA